MDTHDAGIHYRPLGIIVVLRNPDAVAVAPWHGGYQHSHSHLPLVSFLNYIVLSPVTNKGGGCRAPSATVVTSHLRIPSAPPLF